MLAALALVFATEVAAPPADLVAVGLVVATNEGRSVAILRSGGRTRLAGIGDPAFGGRVTAIALLLILLGLLGLFPPTWSLLS